MAETKWPGVSLGALNNLRDSLTALIGGKADTAHTHPEYLTQAETDARYTTPGDVAAATAAMTVQGLADTTALVPLEGQSLVWNASAGEFRYEVVAAGGVVEHGAMIGLADDDHIQYHTDARGDVRYYQKVEVDAAIAERAPKDNPVFTGSIDFGSGKQFDGAFHSKFIGQFTADAENSRKHAVARIIQGGGWNSAGVTIFTVYSRYYLHGGSYLQYMVRGTHDSDLELVLIQASGLETANLLKSLKLEITNPTDIGGGWRYYDIEVYLDDNVQANVYCRSNHGAVHVVGAFTTTEANRLEIWDGGATDYVAVPDFDAVHEVQNTVAHKFTGGLSVDGDAVCPNIQSGDSAGRTRVSGSDVVNQGANYVVHGENSATPSVHQFFVGTTIVTDYQDGAWGFRAADLEGVDNLSMTGVLSMYGDGTGTFIRAQKYDGLTFDNVIFFRNTDGNNDLFLGRDSLNTYLRAGNTTALQATATYVRIMNDFEVAGDTTLDGDLSVAGSLTVTGPVRSLSQVTVTGSTSIAATVAHTVVHRAASTPITITLPLGSLGARHTVTEADGFGGVTLAGTGGEQIRGLDSFPMNRWASTTVEWHAASGQWLVI